MKLLAPLDIAAGRLVSSTVPETDYPQWSAVTIYAKGARVLRTGQTAIYESVTAGNVGHDPASDAANWLAIGTANRWAMFDDALGSATRATGSIEVVLDTGLAVDTLAVLDTDAVSVRVRVISAGTTLHDATQAPDGAMPLLFEGLPSAPGSRITLTLSAASGGAAVDVGTVMVGALADLGVTEAGAGVGITDFSRRETDDFGVTTITDRGWAKRMTARCMVASDQVDATQARLAALRARPCLWIGEAGYDSLTLYGFYKDFTVDLVANSISYCSLTVEGLTEAPQILPPPWMEEDDDPRIFYLAYFPDNPRIGDTVFRTDQGNAQYRYVGIDAPISIGGVVIDIGGSTIAAGQWVLVTDDRLIETIIDTNQAGAVAQEAAARLTRSEQLAIEHQAAIAQGNLDIVAANQEIADIRAMIGDGELDLAGMMERLEATEEDVDTLESTVGGQGASITTMQTTINGQAGTLAQHTIDISTANAAISTQGTALTNLGTQYASLDSTVTTQGATIGTQATALTTLNTQYATLNSTVSSQGVTISNQASAITTLNGNVTTLFGQWVLDIGVNGRVVGIRLANSGAYSSLRFRADLVTFETPDGTGPRTEYSDGTWRIYAGSMMTVWGPGFGSANQFLEWSGPAQASLTGCTEANATKYVKTNGDAYFGGALLAGALRAGSTNPSLSTTASATTGLIGSNGGQINVIASWTYTSTQSNSYPATSTGLSNYNAALTGFGATVSGDGIAEAHTASKAHNLDGSQITLNLRKGAALADSQGGANGTVSLVGWAPIVGDSPGTITWTYTYSKSFTWADPELSTANRQFSADIVRNYTPPGAGQQRVSIQSVEY